MRKSSGSENQLRSQEFNQSLRQDYLQLRISEVENCDPWGSIELVLQANQISFQEVDKNAVYYDRDYQQEIQIGIYLVEGLVNPPPQIEIQRHPREINVIHNQEDDISQAKENQSGDHMIKANRNDTQEESHIGESAMMALKIGPPEKEIKRCLTRGKKLKNCPNNGIKHKKESKDPDFDYKTAPKRKRLTKKQKERNKLPKKKSSRLKDP